MPNDCITYQNSGYFSRLIVDYLDQNTGLYCEAFVRQLTTENILVWDRGVGEIVCIDIDQLNVQDRIQILEIYEIKTPHLCL